MALFKYMEVNKGPQNEVHKVFRPENLNGGGLRPVGVVLPAAQVGHGPVQVHGGKPTSPKLGP